MLIHFFCVRNRTRISFILIIRESESKLSLQFFQSVARTEHDISSENHIHSVARIRVLQRCCKLFPDLYIYVPTANKCHKGTDVGGLSSAS